MIAKYLELTGDPAGLPFKLHDFGYRGVSSLETAALAGAAHLVNFMGTDTMAALPLLRDYYGATSMPGFSIRATEHSVMTAGGPEGEAEIVRKILRSTPKNELVAMVGDSYDMFRFVTTVMATPDIRQMILERTAPVVTRPDSGELPDVDIDVFHALESVFGAETNAKGFRVLNPVVRMIQGDGIEWREGFEGPVNTVEDILRAFYHERISADNIAFGSGGGLLQKWNRDTQRFAIKCSAMKINGRWVDIFKQPKTDPTKNSKRGRLAVRVNPLTREIETVREDVLESPTRENMLELVFENGRLTNQQTLSQVRQQASI